MAHQTAAERKAIRVDLLKKITALQTELEATITSKFDHEEFDDFDRQHIFHLGVAKRAIDVMNLAEDLGKYDHSKIYDLKS